MVYLHPESLSSDPTYGSAGTPNGNRTLLDSYPHHLVRAYPQTEAAAQWAEGLHLLQAPAPLVLTPDNTGRAEVLLDMGTELDAALRVLINAPSLCNMMACFGESVEEAEGWVHGRRPVPHVHHAIGGAGEHNVEFESRGFRFVRLTWFDLKAPLKVLSIAAHSEMMFSVRRGDFRCSDALFQRVWQSSVYTARLCTRPDSFWDGVKRDRHGWFGDARITKETIDLTFFDPTPGEAMLSTLPTDDWGNGIPNFSFDAFAMLRQHILYHGLERPGINETFARIELLLDWTHRTQTDSDGFLIRTDRQYFFGIGFVDWSLMPVGGRFEELCWLQCRYVEGLRTAAQLADWLQRPDLTRTWNERATSLAEKVNARFWKQGVGFLHTLNHVGPVDNPHSPGYGGHYRKTYEEKIQLGPSGPSRQSNALAVWADVTTPEQRKVLLERVFQNPEITPVITPYFAYWEQMARAMCGDAQGGLIGLRDMIGHILETQDAATVWEFYDPNVTDMRRLASHFDLNWDFPASLCHAWGSGSVPYAAQWLQGIRVLEPGYRKMNLDPQCGFGWTFEATVPTPYGTIHLQRDTPNGPIAFTAPDEIEVVANENTTQRG